MMLPVGCAAASGWLRAGACPRNPTFGEPYMNRSIAPLSICFITLTVASAIGADPTGVRTQVLNGQNLDGWHVTGCDVAVENGLLVIKDGNGFVRTDGRYRDFVLELDYKPRKAEMYDSGIYIRSELPVDG